jgi:hypothetical protein
MSQIDDHEEMKKLTQDHVDFCAQWLEGANEVHHAAPYVKKAYDMAVLQRDTFRTLPADPSVRISPELIENTRQSHSYWKTHVPQPPSGIFSNVVSGVGFSTSGATVTVNFLADTSKHPQREVQTWAISHFDVFLQYHTAELNIKFIEQRLKKLHIQVSSEFMAATEEYKHACTGIASYGTTCFAMRNVLETVNGAFLELGRQRQRKIPIKKWQDAVPYVVRGSPTSPEAIKLTREGDTFSTLKDTLTKVAKNDLSIDRMQLDALYATFIGFLFTVCSIADF